MIGSCITTVLSGILAFGGTIASSKIVTLSPTIASAPTYPKMPTYTLIPNFAVIWTKQPGIKRFSPNSLSGWIGLNGSIIEVSGTCTGISAKIWLAIGNGLLSRGADGIFDSDGTGRSSNGLIDGVFIEVFWLASLLWISWFESIKWAGGDGKFSPVDSFDWIIGIGWISSTTGPAIQNWTVI